MIYLLDTFRNEFYNEILQYATYGTKLRKSSRIKWLVVRCSFVGWFGIIHNPSIDT
jgi:hypothetical protein